MNDEDKQSVRSLLSKGYSVPVTAATVGVSQSAVQRLIVKERLLRKGRLPADVAEIEQAIEDHGTVEAAATHYGVTREAVYRRLRIAKQQEEDDG